MRITPSSNWVYSRSIAAGKAKSSDYQQLDLKTDIKEKPVRRIELKGERIVVYTPKDKIDNYRHKAKLITGWRLSRSYKTLYFPLEKGAEILNLFQGYEIDPKIEI